MQSCRGQEAETKQGCSCEEMERVFSKVFRIVIYGIWRFGEDFRHRIELRETLHRACADSSSTVHGGKLKFATKEFDLVSFARDIYRDGILKRLKKPKSRNGKRLFSVTGNNATLCHAFVIGCSPPLSSA